jgi:hypothetical protein
MSAFFGAKKCAILLTCVPGSVTSDIRFLPLGRGFDFDKEFCFKLI